MYHFDVENVALTRLREGDFRGALVDATAGDRRVRHAPVTLVTTSTWWRNSWKYQARTYRHAFWDSGTILANLLAVAASHALSAGVVLGLSTRRLTSCWGWIRRGGRIGISAAWLFERGAACRATLWAPGAGGSAVFVQRRGLSANQGGA